MYVFMYVCMYVYMYVFMYAYFNVKQIDLFNYCFIYGPKQGFFYSKIPTNLLKFKRLAQPLKQCQTVLEVNVSRLIPLTPSLTRPGESVITMTDTAQYLHRRIRSN